MPAACGHVTITNSEYRISYACVDNQVFGFYVFLFRRGIAIFLYVQIRNQATFKMRMYERLDNGDANSAHRRSCARSFFFARMSFDWV
jgi:hypothetical protein